MSTTERNEVDMTTDELQLRYWNATKVTHDTEKAAAAEAELNGRNYWNVQQNERCNPTWIYYGKG